MSEELSTSLDNGETLADALATASDVASLFGGGIPPPIKKNIFSALNRLLTALVDYPVARLEGRTAEVRADTEGRVLLTRSTAAIIASRLDVPVEFAIAASEKNAERIVRHQVNRTKVAAVAVEALKQAPEIPPGTDVPDISDDWLNVFEELAGRMSSEQMQSHFGKILAGEISRPGAFSIKTVNLLAQLDAQAAAIFARFCSLAFVTRGPNGLVDGRVVSSNAGGNELKDFGLSFNDLTVLSESGLIMPTFDSWRDFSVSVIKAGVFRVPFYLRGEMFGLVPLTAEAKVATKLEVTGPALTRAGKELYDIVEFEPTNNAYVKFSMDYFTNLNHDLARINKK